MPVIDDPHDCTATWTPSPSELTRCKATTRAGWPCNYKARIGGYCGVHQDKVPADVMAAHRLRLEAWQNSSAKSHRNIKVLIDDIAHGVSCIAVICAAPFLAFGAMLGVFWILSAGTAMLIMAAD